MTDGGLLKAVTELCGEAGLFPENARVLAGVSGGADSCAMLAALVALKEPLKIAEIGVAHVNHGLRGESAERDAQFVESLAGRFGLPFFMEKISAREIAGENGLCLEEAGRLARYAFFEKICVTHDFSRVAVAHTADDNAETVLMFLLRGAAGAGLSGISPRRGSIVRPLLSANRKQVLEFLAGKGLNHVSDESNQDPAFLRNRIRNELLPLLERAYNPSIRAAMARLADVSAFDEDFWDGFISEQLKNLTLSDSGREIALSAPGLALCHKAVQRRVVRAAVERIKGDLRRIGLVHVDDVLALGTGKTAHLPGGVVAEKTRETLVIARPPDFTARPGKSRKTAL